MTVCADRKRDVVLSTKVLVRTCLAINLDILLLEFLIVLSVKDIADLVLRRNIVVTVRQPLDHLWVLEECLEARNDGEVCEDTPRAAVACIAWLPAEWTVLVKFVLFSVCHAGIDTAIVMNGFDARQDSDSFEYSVLGVKSHLVGKRLSHPIEGGPGHGAHELEFECTNVVTIFLCDGVIAFNTIANDDQ